MSFCLWNRNGLTWRMKCASIKCFGCVWNVKNFSKALEGVPVLMVSHVLPPPILQPPYGPFHCPHPAHHSPFYPLSSPKEGIPTSIPQLRLEEGSSSCSFFFLKARRKNFYLCVRRGGGALKCVHWIMDSQKTGPHGCYDFPASPFPVSWNLTMCHTLINTHRPLRASCSLWCNCRLTAGPRGIWPIKPSFHQIHGNIIHTLFFTSFGNRLKGRADRESAESYLSCDNNEKINLDIKADGAFLFLWFKCFNGWLVAVKPSFRV